MVDAMATRQELVFTVPAGFELTGEFRRPEKGDWFLMGGIAMETGPGTYFSSWPILRKVEPMIDKDEAASHFLDVVQLEYARAASKHAPMNSLHEGYAVLLEEVDELWDQVKLNAEKRDRDNIRTELVQIAAMATRIAVDLGYA